MGLEFASLIILDISLKSPCNNLQEFPVRPCCLRHLSSFFGLNHTQFNNLHAYIKRVIKTKEIATELSFISTLEETSRSDITSYPMHWRGMAGKYTPLFYCLTIGTRVIISKPVHYVLNGLYQHQFFNFSGIYSIKIFFVSPSLLTSLLITRCRKCSFELDL